MDVSAVEQACERLYTAQVGLFFFSFPASWKTQRPTRWWIGAAKKRKARGAGDSPLSSFFFNSSGKKTCIDVAVASVDVAPLPPLPSSPFSLPRPLSIATYAHVYVLHEKKTIKNKTQDAAQRASAEEALAPFRGGVASIGPCKGAPSSREEWEYENGSPSSSLPRRSIRSLFTSSARDRSVHVCAHKGKERSLRCGRALSVMRFR